MTDFACLINCMDGRVQKAAYSYLETKLQKPFIDTITFAGPAKIIAENKKEKLINDIRFRVDISTNVHGAETIAIAGHFDCAMIKVDDEKQIELVKKAKENLQLWYPNATVYGLFVDSSLNVIEC